MEEHIIQQLAGELSLAAERVEAAVKLIDEGNTIPFIARYRKEAKKPRFFMQLQNRRN